MNRRVWSSYCEAMATDGSSRVLGAKGNPKALSFGFTPDLEAPAGEGEGHGWEMERGWVWFFRFKSAEV